MENGADGDGQDVGFNSSVNAEIHELVRRQMPEWRSELDRLAGKHLSEKDLEPLVGAIAESTYKAVTISKTHQGPLPSPAFVREYTEFYPAAAEEIFALAKREQSHRHDWEKEALSGAITEGRRRDIFAAVLVVIGLGLAGYMIHQGAVVVAGLLAGALILGGGAIMFGREFIASHDGKNTRVEVTKGDGTPPPASPKPKTRKR